MNVGELRELLEDIESEWDEEMMGSFDLVPIYYQTNLQHDGLMMNSYARFNCISNSFIIDID